MDDYNDYVDQEVAELATEEFEDDQDNSVEIPDWENVGSAWRMF